MRQRWCKRCDQFKEMVTSGQEICNDCRKTPIGNKEQKEKVKDYIERLRDQYGKRALKKAVDRQWEEIKG